MPALAAMMAMIKLATAMWANALRIAMPMAGRGVEARITTATRPWSMMGTATY